MTSKAPTDHAKAGTRRAKWHGAIDWRLGVFRHLSGMPRDLSLTSLFHGTPSPVPRFRHPEESPHAHNTSM